MKRLFRETGTEKMIGGVAAGLAQYFELDATIMRLVFALGFFSPIPVVTIYFILWVLLPSKNKVLLSQPIQSPI